MKIQFAREFWCDVCRIVALADVVPNHYVSAPHCPQCNTTMQDRV